MDTPLERQLTRALKVLQRQANKEGFIQGGSAVQTIKQAMRISPWQARRLNYQLGLLGLRESSRQGKRHTHTIVLDVTGVTKRDIVRLRQLEKAAAKPSAVAKTLLPVNDPIGEVIAYIVSLENENTLLRRRIDELTDKTGDPVHDPRFQELLARIRANAS